MEPAPKYRYIAEWLRPSDGLPALGVLHKVVGYYGNPYNAMRYLPRHLDRPHLPAGQYRVSTWPRPGEGRESLIVGYITKSA